MINDVLSRPYWASGTAALFDHRALDPSGATFQTMSDATENHVRNDERIGDGKAAIVMGSMSDFGSARQFQILIDQQAAARFRVFLDVRLAEDWLNQPS